MTEALSRREQFLLAQIEQDLRAEDTELDRRLTTMRWDVPPPQEPQSEGQGGAPAVRALGVLLRGLLASAATASMTAMTSVCASLWGLTLACLARLVGRLARPLSTDDPEPAD
ncbi:DUF3040 domain-containing protein [Streptomyces noursei]|uniref:DUF3040 domain-containing protein n=1 Tax=Streptomyces noursei TaxID=1971 RepID=UPI00167AA044|nr:DUF3040 domain-containing protein [Streptomyces noursei]MCZ1020597.1 DUF3040 domain-containing protein [Streptomyces noursei]GGX12533.1 hypothetical protein GCM10010341_37490 [Streptomyces noursei]